MTTVETVHPVFNRTKAPYHDDTNHVITFNLRRYHFPNNTVYSAMLGRLNAAVALLWSSNPEQRDIAPLVQVVRDLQPYAINRVNGSQYRQQNTVDAVTKAIVN
jgi:hypothetical protein